MTSLVSDLDRLYELLARLRAYPGQGRTLGEYSGHAAWPQRGVYFFFEPGEYRRSPPDVPRVVRVGTHAVSAGAKATLWGRLRTHRGTSGGGGNHRGSIFRLHVGAALLAKTGIQVATWGIGSSASKQIRELEKAHERRVSDYLRSMHIVWVAVPDDAGPRSDRSVIERNAIALISNHLSPVDAPSDGWLGRCSPRDEIMRSGLWNLNYVRDPYDPTFLDVLARYAS